MQEIEVGSYELTAASVWRAVAGTEIDDELLEWPPDVLALSDLVLQRPEAHRFALSPPSGVSWPPDRFGDWASAVADAGRLWSAWVEDHDEPFPELLAEEWAVFRSALETSLLRLGEAQDWRVCEAVLTLHAIADESCCGLGVALTAFDGYGAIYRARGRELLARQATAVKQHKHAANHEYVARTTTPTQTLLDRRRPAALPQNRSHLTHGTCRSAQNLRRDGVIRTRANSRFRSWKGALVRERELPRRRRGRQPARVSGGPR